MILRLLIALFVGAFASAQAFEVFSYSEPVAEANPIIRTVIKDDLMKISFVAPAGWSVNPTPASHAVTLGTNQAMITITMATNVSKPTAAAFKNLTLHDEPAATVLEEFDASRGAQIGFGHEIELNNGVRTMVLYYPLQRGVAQVRFKYRSSDAQGLQFVWNNFLNSIQISPPSPRLVSLR